MEMPLNIKEYYMDIQQYLYDKESGVDKCSFSNSELSRKLGISIPTVKKYNKYLIEHGYLEEEATTKTDESGLTIYQKNFNLTSLNQAALWVQAVTQQVTANTQDIEQLKEDNLVLKEENKQMRKEIDQLKKEMSLRRNHVDEPLNIPM
jgi:predicted RNase H-like nuclease (RuvC/YqgF family)